MADILLALSGAAPELDWQNEFVKELTPESFQSELRSHDLNMVNFCAPWCSHCQVFHPTWKEVASAHLNNPRDLIDGVDCVGANTRLSPFPILAPKI